MLAGIFRRASGRFMLGRWCPLYIENGQTVGNLFRYPLFVRMSADNGSVFSLASPVVSYYMKRKT
jgi:hypothetical protein